MKIKMLNYNSIIHEPFLLLSPSSRIYSPIHYDSICYISNQCCRECWRSRMNPCLWLFSQYSAFFLSIRWLISVCPDSNTPNQCCWECWRSRMNPCLWLFLWYSALFRSIRGLSLVCPDPHTQNRCCWE
jgi:hypothetical protein